MKEKWPCEDCEHKKKCGKFELECPYEIVREFSEKEICFIKETLDLLEFQLTELEKIDRNEVMDIELFNIRRAVEKLQHKSNNKIKKEWESIISKK